VEFLIQRTREAPPNALRLLAEALTELGLPPDWGCDAGRQRLVLATPEPASSEGSVDYANVEGLRFAQTLQLVRRACGGRTDIDPGHFSVGRD
jgi:hypothetical protein